MVCNKVLILLCPVVLICLIEINYNSKQQMAWLQIL